jgi:hypothetical protein
LTTPGAGGHDLAGTDRGVSKGPPGGRRRGRHHGAGHPAEGHWTPVVIKVPVSKMAESEHLRQEGLAMTMARGVAVRPGSRWKR